MITCTALYAAVAAAAKAAAEEFALLAAAGDYNTQLMVNVDEISDHFWRNTQWGRDMQDELQNHPFPK